MKRSIFLISMLAVLGSISVVCAQTSSDAYIAAIEAKQITMSPQQKIDYQKKTFALLSLQALRYRDDTQHAALLETLLNVS